MNCPKCQRPIPEPLPPYCPFCQTALHSAPAGDPAPEERPRSDRARIVLLSVFAVILLAALILIGVVVHASLSRKDGQAAAGKKSETTAGAGDERPEPSDGSSSVVTDPTQTQPPEIESEQSVHEGTQIPGENEETPSVYLNKDDISFFGAGENYRLELVGAEVEQVSWRSLDPSVVRAESDGRVYALSPGTTRVVASYHGADYFCWVRCRWENEPDLEEKIERIREKYGAFAARMSEAEVVYSRGYTCYVLDGALAAASLTYTKEGTEVTEHYYYESGTLYFVLVSCVGPDSDRESQIRLYVWDDEIIRWIDSDGTVWDNGDCPFADAVLRGRDCYASVH